MPDEGVGHGAEFRFRRGVEVYADENDALGIHLQSGDLVFYGGDLFLEIRTAVSLGFLKLFRQQRLLLFNILSPQFGKLLQGVENALGGVGDGKRQGQPGQGAAHHANERQKVDERAVMPLPEVLLRAVNVRASGSHTLTAASHVGFLDAGEDLDTGGQGTQLHADQDAAFGSVVGVVQYDGLHGLEVNVGRSVVPDDAY